MLLGLAFGVALAGVVTMAGTARQAEAAFTEKIVFSSTRTTGTGVNNPTGDYEIFTMNPDGTGLKQLTANTATDLDPVLSSDGTKIAYQSYGTQTSYPEGDSEVYRMNALDGSSKKNLTDNGTGVKDLDPVLSPDGTKIAYESYGIQSSNPEGDSEIYRINVTDGLGKKNLSDNGADVYEQYPVYSPGGGKIAYMSYGIQPSSNPEGDEEVYRMNASDGSSKKNLSDNGTGVNEYVSVYSPDGTKIAYGSNGTQNSNSEGDSEVYRMNASDGLGKKNLTDNAAGDGYAVWGVQST